MNSTDQYAPYVIKNYAANVFKVGDAEFILDKRYSPTQQRKKSFAFSRKWFIRDCTRSRWLQSQEKRPQKSRHQEDREGILA